LASTKWSVSHQAARFEKILAIFSKVLPTLKTPFKAPCRLAGGRSSARWSRHSRVAIDAREGDAAGAQRLEALVATLSPAETQNLVCGFFTYFVVAVIDSAGQLLAELPT